MTDSFDRQFARLRENYLLALKTHDMEAIHDYRVAVKRLKALFNLTGCLDPGFRAKIRFRRFRAVFKSSAELRDIHIQMEIAGEFSSLPGFPVDEYLVFLRKRERKAETDMDGFGETVDLARLEKQRQKMLQSLEHMDAVTAARIMRSRFDSLRNELVSKIEGSEPEDREMHAVRILAKEFHYTGEILKECFPELMENGETVFAKLKRVHQALGKWHDYEVALAWVKRFRKRTPSLAELEAAEVERYIGEKKGALREDFLSAWGEFRSEKPARADPLSPSYIGGDPLPEVS